MSQTPRPSHHNVLMFLLLIGIGALIAWKSPPTPPVFDREAFIRSAVSEDLLSGLSRGRQGLVGSLHWTPMPTLLAMPLHRLPPPFGGEYAFLILGIVSAAGIGALLNDWLRRNCAPVALRFAALAILYAAPFFRREMLSGNSNVLFAFLAVNSLCFLLHWLETQKLRSLAYLSASLMLLILTRQQGILLALAATLFVLARLWKERRQPSYLEATLIVFLIPPFYGGALWIAANWLLMGNPFFFLGGLRGLFSSSQLLESFLTLGMDPWIPGVLCGIALGVWLLRWVIKDRLPFAQGALASGIACALFFAPVVAVQRDATDIELIEKVAPYIQEEHSSDWVAVAGYRGYDVRKALPNSNEYVQHTLDFYLNPMLEGTKQRRLYLLAPEPRGVDRWEDIHLVYPGLYQHDGRFVIFERTWKHWRLWRVVKLDETDRQ